MIHGFVLGLLLLWYLCVIFKNQIGYLYLRLNNFSLYHIGFANTSPKRYLLKNHQPFVWINKTKVKVSCEEDYTRSSTNCIYLLHGASGTPRSVDSIFNHLVSYNKYDIYVGLLGKHATHPFQLNSCTPDLILNKCLEDIQVLLHNGYDKVYLIGHSSAALAMLALSLDDKLIPNNRIQMILICPYVCSLIRYPSIDWLGDLGILFPKLYPIPIKAMMCYIHEPWLSIKPPAFIHCLYQLSNRVTNRLIMRSRIQNEYYCILSDNDCHIPCELAMTLFDKNRVRVINDAFHEPFFHTHVKPEFYTILDSTLSAFDRI